MKLSPLPSWTFEVTCIGRISVREDRQRAVSCQGNTKICDWESISVKSNAVI